MEETSTFLIRSYSEDGDFIDGFYKIVIPRYNESDYQKIIESAKDFIDHCRNETNVDYVKSCTEDLIELFNIDLNEETLEEYSNWEDNTAGGTLESVLKFIEKHFNNWSHTKLNFDNYDADYGEFY